MAINKNENYQKNFIDLIEETIDSNIKKYLKENSIYLWKNFLEEINNNHKIIEANKFYIKEVNKN